MTKQAEELLREFQEIYHNGIRIIDSKSEELYEKELVEKQILVSKNKKIPAINLYHVDLSKLEFFYELRDLGYIKEIRVFPMKPRTWVGFDFTKEGLSF